MTLNGRKYTVKQEENNDYLAQFQEPGSCGDTHSGQSQFEPSPVGGTIVVPTGGGCLQLPRQKRPMLWLSLLFAASSVLRALEPPGMYEQYAVL